MVTKSRTKLCIGATGSFITKKQTSEPKKALGFLFQNSKRPKMSARACATQKFLFCIPSDKWAETLLRTIYFLRLRSRIFSRNIKVLSTFTEVTGGKHPLEHGFRVHKSPAKNVAHICNSAFWHMVTFYNGLHEINSYLFCLIPLLGCPMPYSRWGVRICKKMSGTWWYPPKVTYW